MATKASITAAQYLATPYEREPEFVRGELVERSLPTFSHGDIQLEVGSRLRVLGSLDAVCAGDDLTTIALACGFASHSHFTWAFRQTLGVPPSAVRAGTAKVGLRYATNNDQRVAAISRRR